MKKIVCFFASALLVIMLAIGVLRQPVFAIDICDTDVCSLPNAGDNPACQRCDVGLGGTFENIMNVVLAFVGIVAVIVIIIAGVTISTSSGEAAKVMKGKRTIVYALVGLIIALLAWTIVKFVASSIESYTEVEASSKEECLQKAKEAGKSNFKSFKNGICRF